jgi:V/A-type H+-transporting ATPase subunit A
VTLIAAISPPGGDFSEPVTQAALRVAGGLWALDARLAQQRQFPAVSWETSYSRYAEETADFFRSEAGADWVTLRRDTLALMQQERELREVAELVGQDALEDADRLVLETARLLRDSVLGQSAFDPNDAFSPLSKTRALARLALGVRTAAGAALARGVVFEALDLGEARRALWGVRDAPAAAVPEAIARAEAVLARLAEPGVTP